VYNKIKEMDGWTWMAKSVKYFCFPDAVERLEAV